MKHPGGLKRPGWFVLSEASSRRYAHASAPRREGKWRPPLHPSDQPRYPYVICIFNINKEGFNDVSSIKTDIYFALGCVLLAASSILRYVAKTQEAGIVVIRLTFQNKQHVSFRISFSVLSSHGSTDPRSRFIEIRIKWFYVIFSPGAAATWLLPSV